MATLSDTILTQLKLAGQRAYAAGMNAAAGASERLAAANVKVEESAAAAGKELNRRLLNLGTLGVMARRAATGVAILGGVATYTGLKFDASMEQSNIAFTELLNSGTQAQSMLNDLFELAAKTPFEFPQLVDATQKLLGFGMASGDVLPLLTKVGDAVAAVGADPERIDRMTRALGQMQAKGKVYSEELLQLADAGLPAYQMLAKGLNVSGDQLNKMLRKGQVDAKTGLNILASQMEARYSGMAAKQAKSFSGLLSTLRDYTRLILGQAVQPLFNYLERKVLPVIAKVEEGIVRWGRSGGFERFQKNLSVGFGRGREAAGGPKAKGLLTPDKQMGLAASIGQKAGKVFQAVKGYIGQLMDALRPMKPFWDNVLGPLLKGLVVGALGGFVGILKLAIPVIKVVATALGWFGTVMKPFRGVFFALGFAIGFVFGPGKIFSTALKALGALGRFIGLIFRPFTWLIRIIGRFGSVIGRVFGWFAYRLAITRGVVGESATWIITKFEGIVGFFRGMPGKLKAVFFGVINAFYSFGKEIINAMWNGMKAAPGKAFGFLNKIASKLVPGIPGRALGGAVRAGQPYVVGEHQPELFVPDSAGYIKPKLGSHGLGDFVLHNYMVLDGQIVSRSVAKHNADRMARR